jgi:hypothetical protein
MPAAKLVRQIRSDLGFGNIVQTGDGDVLAARAESREHAFQGGMAQHTF